MPGVIRLIVTQGGTLAVSSMSQVPGPRHTHFLLAFLWPVRLVAPNSGGFLRMFVECQSDLFLPDFLPMLVVGIRYYGAIYVCVFLGGFWLWKWQMLQGANSSRRNVSSPWVSRHHNRQSAQALLLYEPEGIPEGPVRILYFWQGVLRSRRHHWADLRARLLRLKKRCKFAKCWTGSVYQLHGAASRGYFMNSESWPSCRWADGC